MKRIVTIICALLLLISLVGCSKKIEQSVGDAIYDPITNSSGPGAPVASCDSNKQ